MHLEQAGGPPGAGDRFIQRDDHGGELDELHQDLEHIVIQRDSLPLGEPPKLDL